MSSYNNLDDFCENGWFHVYNRTNNKELLFRNEDDCGLFLSRYQKYLSPFQITLSWSAMPTHFHFVVQLHSSESIFEYVSQLYPGYRTCSENKFISGQITLEQFMEKTWMRLFTSYAMRFNATHKRKGNLFYRPFKRKKIENEFQLKRAIGYVNTNAQKHGIVDDFRKYPWSSWHEIIHEIPSLCNLQAVLDLFGGIQRFHDFHLDYAKSIPAKA